jgi:hypothetical protein
VVVVPDVVLDQVAANVASLPDCADVLSDWICATEEAMPVVVVCGAMVVVVPFDFGELLPHALNATPTTSTPATVKIHFLFRICTSHPPQHSPHHAWRE